MEKNGIKALHVSDPVLLLDEKFWSAVTRKPSGMKDRRYILYYTLKNDEQLIMKANDTAKRLGLQVISIHPNANRLEIGKQLYGIGPREFLWMIQNAEYVCTNSFHASAFSLIFKKKLLHSQFEKGKGRVQSLFDTVSAKRSMDENGTECIDLSGINQLKLKEYISTSKEYLAGIYEKEENH